MTVIGNRIWVFDKSSPSHETRFGYVRDKSTLALLGFFRHNISHAATVDYSTQMNLLMIGNGGDGTLSTGPRIDLLPRFSTTYDIGSFLDWYDPVSTPRISIPLNLLAADGTVLRSVLPGSNQRTANAVFVDEAGTILVFGQTSTGLVASTVQLGLGNRDYSSEGYGTFVPARPSNEPNGTARVVATYRGTMLGTTQGADFHDGKLYLGLTGAPVNQRAIEVLELSLASNGTLVLDRRFFYQPPDQTGSPSRFETEGVTFRGNELLVSAIRADGYQSIYSFANTATAVDQLP